MKELKEYLASHPKVKKVWMNKKGEWLFSKRPGFEEKSRKEILGAEDVEETVAPEVSTESTEAAETKAKKK